MQMTPTDETELLTALNGGLLQERPWKMLLIRLRARTKSRCVRLYERSDGDTWRLIEEVIHAQNEPASERAITNELFSLFDRWRSFRVYTAAELDDTDDGDARYIKVATSDGAALTLAIHAEPASYSARDSALLAGLAPHLATALSVRIELDRRALAVDLSANLLSQLNIGWAVIDANHCVVTASPVAIALLGGSGPSGVSIGGQLRMVSPEGEDLLKEAGEGAQVPPAPAAGWLSYDPPVQTLLTDLPPGLLERFHDRGFRLLLIRAVNTASLENGRHLQRLYRLSHREAMLAARLCEGHSLTEAATLLGLTVETARNYSKRIFAKTGSRGQPDLIRKLLGGITVVH